MLSVSIHAANDNRAACSLRLFGELLRGEKNMPALEFVWAMVVLLATVIYYFCVLYKKDLQKYRHWFAAITTVVCLMLAIGIEVLLRAYDFKMPDFVENVFFYAKYGAIYGGAYGLVTILTTGVFRVLIQASLILFLCFYSELRVGEAVGGYKRAHHCPRPAPPNAPRLVTNENFSAVSPAVWFWRDVFVKVLHSKANCQENSEK